jgi:hypothetical protein
MSTENSEKKVNEQFSLYAFLRSIRKRKRIRGMTLNICKYLGEFETKTRLSLPTYIL